MRSEEPIFNVPGAVLGALAVIVGLHVVRQFLSTDTDSWLVLALAFIPARYSELAAELPGGEAAQITSLFTHMLVHGDAMHLIFNSAWLLAFGGAIAHRVGGTRFLALSIVCGLAGAAAFYLVNPNLLAPVIGASGAISGLMGATMRFLFNALQRGGLRRLREDPASIPLMPLATALTDRRVLTSSAVFLALNVLAMFGFGAPETAGGIAWEAHVGGYVAGLTLMGWFDRPALQHAEDQPTFH